MYRPLIAFLAVSGLIFSLSAGIRLQAHRSLSSRQNSTRVGAERVAAEHSTWSDYAGAPDGSPVFGARADQSIHREPVAGCVELSDR